MSGNQHAKATGPRVAIATAVVVALSGCIAEMPRAIAAPPASSLPPLAETSQVFVYPNAGQSETQQDRDRYECNAWAVKQTSFDPSAPQLPPHERVQVVSVAGPPPGSTTVAGAATGAIIGAAVARPRQLGEGALLGAVAGALVGASAEAANQQRTEIIQQHYDQRDLQAQMRSEQRARDFRRAISACLEGRGYTVK